MAVWEALKIDRLPDKKRVHLWFLILFVLAAAVFMTESGTSGMLDFQQKILQFLTARGEFPFPTDAWLISVLKKTGLLAAAVFFILLYAVHWLTVSSGDDGAQDSADDFRMNPLLPDFPLFILKNGSTPLAAIVRVFPSVLLIAFSSLIVYVVSLPLYGIPFFVMAAMLSMSAFAMIFDGKSIPSALEASTFLTNGMKLVIFISFFMLRTITNLGEQLLQLVMGTEQITGGLISAFFFALKTLAFGRMTGILYRLAYYKDSPLLQNRLDGQ